jgi:hypothetical protein
MRSKGGKKGNQSIIRRNNPKRGSPGMLLFCETGRERKCLGEAIEILNHYYYTKDDNDENDSDNNSNNNDGDDDDDDDDDVNNKKNNDAKKKKIMTLEEEIQMMKKGTKKTPFKVYETGCRGAVFVMCTSKNSNLIEVKQPEKIQSNCPGQGDEDNGLVVDGGNDNIDCNDKGDKANNNDAENKEDQNKNSNEGGESNETTFNTKRKIDGVDSSNHKKQKKESEETTATTATTQKLNEGNENQQSKWDPIQTIEKIVQDIRNNDTTAPRSRFITKMIPIQATCFANMEEIKPTAHSLLEKFLLPHGTGTGAAKSEIEIDTKNEKSSKETSSTSSLPTFKIEFRKRFCSHMRRDEVIQVVADVVQTLTAEYWKSRANQNKDAFIGNDNKKEDTKQDQDDEKNDNKKEEYPPLFGVDLGNPDFTIIIEICRTLCTMAVVKNAQSYHQFNLMKIQENIDS